MIDIDRIEKAYLRFKTLYDTLVFKAVNMKQDGWMKPNPAGKETKDDVYRWEVRCNSRVIWTALHNDPDAEKQCVDIVKELNELLQPFIEKQYTKFLDEVIVSKNKFESSN